MSKQVEKAPTKDSIIRDYLAKFPALGPTELAAKIESENRTLIKSCKSAEVSVVKTKLKKEGGAVTTATTKQSSKSGPSASPAYSGLKYFASLREAVRELGYEQAKEILEAAR